jgi:hypothetical protein
MSTGGGDVKQRLFGGFGIDRKVVDAAAMPIPKSFSLTFEVSSNFRTAGGVDSSGSADRFAPPQAYVYRPLRAEETCPEIREQITTQRSIDFHQTPFN